MLLLELYLSVVDERLALYLLLRLQIQRCFLVIVDLDERRHVVVFHLLRSGRGSLLQLVEIVPERVVVSRRLGCQQFGR